MHGVVFVVATQLNDVSVMRSLMFVRVIMIIVIRMARMIVTRMVVAGAYWRRSR